MPDEGKMPNEAGALIDGQEREKITGLHVKDIEESGPPVAFGNEERMSEDGAELSATEEGATSEAASGEKGPSTVMKVVAVAVGSIVVFGSLAALLVLSLGAEDAEDGDDDGTGLDPLVTLDAETFGFVGTRFRFSVMVTGNTTAPSVSWRFGDGGTATGLIAEHIFASPGNYTLNVTVNVDGRAVYRTASVEVRPVPTPESMLPPGNPPDWRVSFSGVPSMSEITLLGMTEPTGLLERVNMTLDGEMRSFIGIRLLDLFDLTFVRSDAEGFRIIGETTYSGKVHHLMMEEGAGGNSSYLFFAEGGKWLNDTSFVTPLMFLGPEPESGDLVKAVRSIETDPLEIVFTGPGLEVTAMLSFEGLQGITEYRNYSVSNGRETRTWIGFPLWDIVQSIGVKRNATDVRVGALDGYSQSFGILDVIDNPESDMPFFLAFGVEGEPLSREEGPYRLVAPDSDYTEDDGHNWFTQSWIKQVGRVVVGASGTPAPPIPWGDPAPGTLAIEWSGGSATFSTEELSSMWDHIIELEATLVKSTGERYKATYAGVDLFDLIALAGGPGFIGEIELTSGDGYSYTADAMELSVRETEEMNATMVALAENGQWLDATKGPLRIVGSGLPSKGWVSDLRRIGLEEWKFDLDGVAIGMSKVLGMAPLTAPVFSKGVVTNYTGIDLVELGMARGAGAIEVAGYDYSNGRVNATGYSMVIDLVQYAGAPPGERPFLAYLKEGEPLPLWQNGPLRMMVPGQSSRYWVGSVKRVVTVPHSFLIQNGSTKVGMTIEELKGLSFFVDGGNASALNGTGVARNVSFSGVSLEKLVEHVFGPSFGGNLTITLADGTEVLMGRTELSGPNRTAYIAWDLDGRELSLWNGLFALVLSDPSPGDDEDWTEDMWRFYVVSVEVSS